jgi:tetratricopeptide (TPR) repeat protein|tara:strand:+ start:1343 stop:2749 length:1407 start_codon:yes stop_codon:yes gene_type:complete
MNKKFSIYLFSILAILFVVTPVTIEAQSQANKKPIKYKKSRVLQSKTAKVMAEVYEALEVVDEKGEPAPDMEVVLRNLNQLLENKDNLKSYDRSVMWNAWAFVYFSDGNYPKAMDAYARLIDEPEVTIGLRVGALLSLAQLNLLEENYEKGIELILQWMSEVETITAQSYSLLGQAYYQTGDFKKALSSMETAVTMAEEEGYKPRENWYVIMAACIGEMKKEIGEKESLLRQIDIYEILVNYYPKKQYFIQLGGSYGQLGREKEYMIVLKAAYQKDLLNRESEYLALTQLLLLNQNPYWAAEVFEHGQKKMITIVDEKTEEEKIVPVIKDTEKNLKLLADAWRMAQEIDKAIPVLEKAAKMSKTGEAYVLLGNLYLSEDKLEQAADAILKGLEKGKIKKLSPVYLTLGQVYFELQKFDDAKKNFGIAARDKDEKIQKQATNWIRFTENEEIRIKNLALRRDYIQMNST